MAKQAKKIKSQEVFKEFNSELSELLKKCDSGTSVKLLKPDEREKLWDVLLNTIQENNCSEASEEKIQAFRKCIKLVLTILNSNAEIKSELVNIIKYINSEDVLIDETQTVDIICRVNEYWMCKIQAVEEIPGMEYLTVKHLLNLCTSNKPLVSDIQRLNAIKKSMTAVPFDKNVPSLRPLLIKLVQNAQFLCMEQGQKFIAHALVLSHKIMKDIHKTIMLDLSSCSKKKAMNYGKIYVMAWHGASEDMKGSLVITCFQDLMETMMKVQRTSLELDKNGQNILTMLEVWHAERKKKNPQFITMITNAYQPILWKYLESGFNVYRCNATNVFFKAFPLQRSGDNAVDAETLFNEQYKTMLASLTDDCHIVRIIAVREICNILSLYWNSFSPAQIQNLMSVITKQNATDASSAEGRRMVFIGFQTLVKSSLSREYAKQILPNLADHIHDVNQRVRIAFVQLLICIKDLKDPDFKYSDVVPMFDIQYRLAEDNVAVGQWIVKLLMKNYYHSNMAVVEWMKRFIYLLKTYQHSYRNFFFYSGKSLPFPDACTIIYEILSRLGTFVLEKLGADAENSENMVASPPKKKKTNKKTPLTNSNARETSSEEAENPKKCAFDDIEVVSGLFDIVTILWVLHDIQLCKAENEEIRFKLYDTYIKYAQPFINYYKDCRLFLGVITLSGNIPASLLRSNSITLPGYCIKMLKSVELDRNEEENEKIMSMLIALVKWGRGGEILEQITLWLEAAFETKDMNETILPRRRVRISESVQPNSVAAICILDSLLKIDYVKLSILRKNYPELFHLWKFMSKIQKLIETRIEQGEPFEEDLVSDQFLQLCFRRFVKLIPILKDDDGKEGDKENRSQNDLPETFVNRQKEMENVIEWGENFLFPLLQQEVFEEADADLVIAALEDILYVSDNMIIIHSVNNMFHFKIGYFALKLLDTRFGIRFVKAASRVTAALNYSAKLLFKVNDDFQIFSTVIPSLLSHTLNVLTWHEITTKELQTLEKDLPVIKSCFGKVLAAYQDNLSSTSGLKENVRHLKLVVSFFVDCFVNMLGAGIPREDSTVPLYTTLSQLPPIVGSLFTLFYNKKTWTPLFIHVLNAKLATKSYDVKNTVAAVLIIYLLSELDKKLNEGELKRVLVSAGKTLTKLKESVRREEHQTDTNTARGSWTSNAATNGYSSTCTGLLRETENDDNPCPKVVRDGEEVSSGENTATKVVTEGEEVKESETERPEFTESFRCDGDNLEFVKKGKSPRGDEILLTCERNLKFIEGKHGKIGKKYEEKVELKHLLHREKKTLTGTNQNPTIANLNPFVDKTGRALSHPRELLTVDSNSKVNVNVYFEYLN